MIFVKSQQQLEKVFGNDIMVVEGEKTLFDKISLDLASAEDWLISQIVGETTATAMVADSTIFNLCVTIVACEALRRTIPALDLVLTPNGFGIVQNNNVVPASKERVERFIKSCTDRRDFAISRLYPMLYKTESWLSSEQREFWTRSPLQDLNLADSYVLHREKPFPSKWDALMAMREYSEGFVTRLAERYISFEVMARICSAMCSDGDDEESVNDRVLGSKIVSVVLGFLNGKMFKHQMIDAVVNYLRKNDDAWKASSVAEYYAEPTFQNTKDSKGYWF